MCTLFQVISNPARAQERLRNASVSDGRYSGMPNWKHAIVYFYDFINLSKIPKLHLRHIEEVFQLLHKVEITKNWLCASFSAMQLIICGTWAPRRNDKWLDFKSDQVATIPAYCISNEVVSGLLWRIAQVCFKCFKAQRLAEQVTEEREASTIWSLRLETQGGRPIYRKLITPPLLSIPSLNGWYKIDKNARASQAVCVDVYCHKSGRIKF